jgi:Arc/MetJ-type ribon-helix-helix transcriptional regulator
VPIQLHAHQWKAVTEISNGSIVTGGVGSGKTITALAYYTVSVLGRDTIDKGRVRIGSTSAFGPGADTRGGPRVLPSRERADRKTTGDIRSRGAGSSAKRNGGISVDRDRVSVGRSGGGRAQVPDVSALPDIYVITTAKKRDDKDWEKEAAPFAISTDSSESIGGVKIVVDSWNSIVKYTEVKNAFFVFDEQRLVGSGAWVKAFIKIAKANQWILLSATPGDSWVDYIPVMVAHGYYKNRTDFVRQHVVFAPYTKFPKIDRYVDTGKLVRIRERIRVEMPLERHTRRHVTSVIVDHNVAQMKRVWVDRWHIYEDRPLKDVGEMFMVARKLVNSDASRLGAVMQKHEEFPRLIIFYSFDYELEALRTLGNTLGLPVAEWNGHKHEQIPETKSWLYLVQYTAGAEGWNCIVTNATLFYSLNYSWKVFEQAQGRIDRINTDYINLYYFVLRSSARVDQLIQKALSSKQVFNERKAIKW